MAGKKSLGESISKLVFLGIKGLLALSIIVASAPFPVFSARTESGGGSGDPSEWTYGETFGAANLTPTSTVAVWLPGPVNASSTLQVDGTSQFNSTTTHDGALQITDGSLTIPGLHFSSDTNTGIYSPAEGDLSIVLNGQARFRFDNVPALAVSLTNASGSPAFYDQSDTDTGFNWGGPTKPNQFHIISGGAEKLSIYPESSVFSSTASTTIECATSSATQGCSILLDDVDGTGVTKFYANNGTLFSSQSPSQRTVGSDEWEVMSGSMVVTGIDGKTTGTTTLYTVPADKQLVVERVIVIPTMVADVVAPPTVSVGKTASSYLDVIDTIALTGLTETGLSTILSPIAGASVLGAGDSLVLNISAGATATSYTFKAIVIGYLI